MKLIKRYVVIHCRGYGAHESRSGGLCFESREQAESAIRKYDEFIFVEHRGHLVIEERYFLEKDLEWVMRDHYLARASIASSIKFKRRERKIGAVR